MSDRTAEYDADIALMYGTAAPSIIYERSEDLRLVWPVGEGVAYYPTGESPDLISEIDFTQWYNVAQSPMDSMTTDSFTNVGTGYIQLDIGAEAGKTYEITVDQTRGSGTLLIYLAADQGVTQAAEVYGLEGGREVIQLVADGPYLTFRASVGDTTTTVTELSVVEVVEEELVGTLDFTKWTTVFDMDTTSDTFTNNGAAAVCLDIGAEAGESYEITADLSRDAGTLIAYFKDSPSTARSDSYYTFSNAAGEQTFTLEAEGSWLVLRASAGNTTTTVTSLSVKKITG